MIPANPHYLHDSAPIEAVLSPSLDSPRALSWLPGKETLLVACADGRVHSVEPVWGVRTLFSGRPDPVQISTQGERIAILSRDGRLGVYRSGEDAPLWEGETPFLSHMGVRWWSGGIAAIGEDLESRQVIVFDTEGRVKSQARVPARAALGSSATGHLLLARSVAQGLFVAGLGKPLPTDEATAHTLRFTHGGRVIGVLPTGATVWNSRGAAPVSAKLQDTTAAALHPDGSLFALGTRPGGVAIASARPGTGNRANPRRIEGHSAPVQMVSFSAKGRWLATIADSCRIWAF